MSADMDVAARLDEALASADPDQALQSAVRSLLAEGRTRLELVDALSAYRKRVPAERDEDHERLLDMMAVLNGYSKSSRLRDIMPSPCKAPGQWRIA